MIEETGDGSSTPETGDDSLDAAVSRLMAKRLQQDSAPVATAPDSEAVEAGSDDGAEMPETDDADEAPEGEGVDEQAATEEAPETEKFPVRVDGKDIEVDRDELIRGYQRLSDYTRKTQALADERRSLEGQREEIARLRAEAQQRLETIAKLQPMEGMGAQEAKLVGLAQSDTAAFYAELGRISQDDPAEALRVQIRVHSALAQQEQASREAQKLAAQAKAERMEAAAVELLRIIPEWQKPEVAKREKAELFQYATTTLRLTPETIGQLEDPRLFAVMRKAMLYDRSRETVAKLPPKAPAPKVVKPGAIVDKSAAADDQIKRARTQLGRSGSIDDAVSIRLMQRAARQ